SRRGGEAEPGPEAGKAQERRQRALGVAAGEAVDAVGQHQRRKHREHLAEQRQQEGRSEPQAISRSLEARDQDHEAADRTPDRRRLLAWYRLRHCPALTARHLEQSLKGPLKCGGFSSQWRW